MGYFNFLPNVGYTDDRGNLVLVKNILTRAKILDIIKETQATALEYTIRDEERPEYIDPLLRDFRRLFQVNT